MIKVETNDRCEVLLMERKNVRKEKKGLTNVEAKRNENLLNKMNEWGID